MHSPGALLFLIYFFKYFLFLYQLDKVADFTAFLFPLSLVALAQETAMHPGTVGFNRKLVMTDAVVANQTVVDFNLLAFEMLLM